MTIVYIHGYNSSSATSNTCAALREWFDEDNIICLDYDFMNPAASAEHLYEEIEDIGHEDIDLIVGSSLGGFWARWLANEFGIPLLMINPSLDPASNLSVYRTYTEGDLKTFTDFYIEKDSPDIPITLVLGMSDIVVDPQIAYKMFVDRAKIFTIANEGHRISSKTLKDFVSYAANNIALA